MKIVAKNKKAFFEYNLDDKVEAGLVLTGKEVKSARANKVSINGSQVRSFMSPKGKPEFWLIGSNFADEADQTRTRKLLLNKHEISKMIGKLASKEQIIIPLELYFDKGRLKVSIALAIRRKKEDKREVIKKRDTEREISRELRTREKNSK